MANPLRSLGSPNGTRTRVTGVRGRRPRPLDDGTMVAGGQGFEPWFAGPEPAVLPLNDPPVSFLVIFPILSFDVKQKMVPSFLHHADNIRMHQERELEYLDPKIRNPALDQEPPPQCQVPPCP
jgi:hypothetical protein